jgi:predicted nucleic acid-binding protein
MILIDTNVFIDLLRGYEPAINFFNLIVDETVIFSAITEAELISGKECNDKDKRLDIIYSLSQWNKIAVTNEIALLAGDITRNNNTKLPDAIIAATAILNNAEIITKNLSDFSKIKNAKVRLPY